MDGSRLRTEALIKAGIARLVSATYDRIPSYQAEVRAKLQAAGVEVQTGLMANEARTLNIGFIARMARERPWVEQKLRRASTATYRPQ